MEKFIIFLGLNDKDTKKQEISTLSAYKIANNIIFKYLEGATILEANGIYKHDNGEFVIEKSLQIELLFTDKKTVEKIASELKNAFNQESVIIQRQIIESDLL